MPNVNEFRTYVKRLNENLALGNATEHTHRSALKTLIESVRDGITATNEPKRIECGAPDFVVTKTQQNPLTLGYVEAKDIGASLDQIERDSSRAKPSTANGNQFKRYRNSLSNLVLTDYTEFRWYVDGERRSITRLAEFDGSEKLASSKAGIEETVSLLSDFLQRSPDPVSSPQELARRMARPTHMIRDIVAEGFSKGGVSDSLRDFYTATRSVLVPDLTTETFADMFAQTLAYGLFAARVNHEGGTFSRLHAAGRIPRTNPFVRRIFDMIGGATLEDEPFVSFVDDLAQLLNNADMDVVLSGFGRRSVRQDPVMHFYETFLAEYDPTLREQRGVYYTPEPVVSYIVRSVDHILRERFDCPEGLADRGMTTYETSDPDGNVTQRQSHRVLVLDPACGSGTFLYAVVDHIREHYRTSGNAGMWGGYVKDHLIKRLFGFELIMAAYAMSHLKLGMQLAAHDMPEEHRAKWAYDFDADERLGVYLTNTLEQAERQTIDLFGPMRIITEEANAASEIKRDLPIMVVLGNPPYSGHSANASRKDGKLTWIGELIEDYKQVDGKPLGERNSKWLQDDYVKFIRFGQHRIQQTGAGILAFITNHSYLENPTFRGMRQQLMETFSDIYLLDLHGNSRTMERSPDGGVDENVFDIQQGVAIAIFVKYLGKDSLATVHHADLWGTRDSKYESLSGSDLSETDWNLLEPRSPRYMFKLWDRELEEEYGTFPKITEIMPVNSVGVVTGRDKEAIRWSVDEMIQGARSLVSSDEEVDEQLVVPILYRPFDTRHTYYSNGLITRPRQKVMRHMLAGTNLGLIFMRQVALHDAYSHFAVSRAMVDNRAFYSSRGIMSFAPLYTYPSEQEIAQGLYKLGERQPNLSPEFIDTVEKSLGLRFVSDGQGDLYQTLGPEDVFHYIYAVFHSPTYRERYNQFLRVDFPRVPLTDAIELFRALADLGGQLKDVHLMESLSLHQTQVSFPVAGDNVMEKGHPKYYAPGDTPPGKKSPVEQGRVYISKDASKYGKKGQYFEGIPSEVWEFRMGGYQPLDKWLKDRRGRTLSFDDLNHYRRIAAALTETIRLMADVDQAITHSGELFTQS